MAGKVFLETEKSSEEEVDETRIQRKKERETWEEAVSRETKAKQDHEAITYSPGRMDALIKKAVLFQESHSKVIRSLRAPVVLFMTFLGFSAHGVNLLITFHADIFYAVGFIVSTTSIVAKWFPVYFEDGIRDGNNLGVGLRIFRLLDSKDASSIGNNMSTGSALSIFVLCVGVILQIVYFVMIWNTMPIWGRAVFLAGQLMISFVPASCLTALTFLFFQTCDGCSLLIRKQQVFVFEDANIVGGVDWDRTQRNFDILERFIEDLNSGWYSYFFVTEFFLPLGCVLMILGVVNNSLSWAQADHSPPATLVLLLSESCYTAAFLLYIVLIWVSASEVTAACDEVSGPPSLTRL